MVFGRVIVHGRERFPRRGAVLVCANHPAMWTDALVLETALRRPLHFLVLATLFDRGLRRWFLRVFGALPVHAHDDRATAGERNDPTTRACLRLFRGGEVVVTFPEGVSAGDWRLEPFKPGAAWLALDAEDPGAMPALVPVGLHYRERTAWRSDVEVSIGAPLDLAPFRREPDRSVAAHALTFRLFSALSALAVNAADPEIERATRALLPLVVAHDAGGTAAATRRLARRLEAMRRADHARFVDLGRRARQYRRMRSAIGVDEASLCEPRDAAAGRLLLGAPAGALGATAALAGWAIHWLPRRLTEIVAQRFAPEPTRIAFGRAVAGLTVFPLFYVLAGTLLLHAGRWPHARIWVLLGAAATLGVVSLACRRWVARIGMRVRVNGLEWFAPRTMARVRAARAAVLERMP